MPSSSPTESAGRFQIKPVYPGLVRGLRLGAVHDHGEALRPLRDVRPVEPGETGSGRPSRSGCRARTSSPALSDWPDRSTLATDAGGLNGDPPLLVEDGAREGDAELDVLRELPLKGRSGRLGLGGGPFGLGRGGGRGGVTFASRRRRVVVAGTPCGEDQRADEQSSRYDQERSKAVHRETSNRIASFLCLGPDYIAIAPRARDCILLLIESAGTRTRRSDWRTIAGGSHARLRHCRHSRPSLGRRQAQVSLAGRHPEPEPPVSARGLSRRPR